MAETTLDLDSIKNSINNNNSIGSSYPESEVFQDCQIEPVKLETDEKDEESESPRMSLMMTTANPSTAAIRNDLGKLAVMHNSSISNHLKLPMIAVMGDTSSGKSSLLSSLSGIELPSASTLTTKCPILLHLSKGELDRATIRVQWRTSTTCRQPWTQFGMTERRIDSSQSTSTQNTIIGSTSSPTSASTSNKRSITSRERKRELERDVTPQRRSKGNSWDVNAATLLQTWSQTTHSPPPPPPPPPPTFEPRVVTTDFDTQLPLVLKEAQDFILDYRKTHVAPDVVSVQLEGPNISHDLTLVDLPGLVQFQPEEEKKENSLTSSPTASGGTGRLIHEVHHVMQDYFRNERCILLVVLSAHVDIHNSRLLSLARTADPTTSRTIPVLTKPDLLDPGSERDILELLQPTNKTNKKFRHGFHMVKNRGQAALDSHVTIAEGLKLEQNFFDNTEPWSSTLWQTMDLPCLGVPSLRQKLADLQLDMTRESLPSILEEISTQQDICQKTLHELGPRYPTQSERRRYYQTLLQQFMDNLSASLSGKGRRQRYQGSQRGRSQRQDSRNDKEDASNRPLATARLHEACAEFCQGIRSGSLATIQSLVEGAQVLVSTPIGDDVRGEIVHVDEQMGFCCVDYIDPKDHTTDVLFDFIGYTSAETDLSHKLQSPPSIDEDEVWTDGKKVYIARKYSMFDSLRKLPLKRVRTDPSWLVQKIAQYRTDDLACFLNVDIFKHIVAEFVQEDWAPHCHELLETTEGIIKVTLQDALNDTLAQSQISVTSKSRYPRMQQMLEQTCQDVAKTIMAAAKEQLDAHIELEQHHPYTQDDVLLDTIAKARYRILKRDLEFHLGLEREGAVLETQAIASIIDRVLDKHSCSNTSSGGGHASTSPSMQLYMAEELELILSSYGEIATKRALDRTPMICWQAFRTLKGRLHEALGCFTDDVLETCLTDDIETTQLYNECTTKLEEWKQATELIQSLLR